MANPYRTIYRSAWDPARLTPCVRTHGALRSRAEAFTGLVIIAASSFFLASCGGTTGGTGGGAAAGGRAGTLAVAVTWPAPSGRLVPAAAQSVDVTLSGANGASIAHQIITRPTQPPWTTVGTFPGLQPGALTLSASAFPNADATGVAQAKGSVPATITAGQQTSVTLTMASTIKTLTVTPANPSVAVGAGTVLTATAYDASNSVVLISPSKVTWAPTAGGSAVVGPATGLTTTATGHTAGTQTVTATDTESGVSGTVTVTVTPPSGGCTPGPVTGPGFLAKAGWAKFGGTLGNTGVGGGSGARGQVKWTTTAGQGGTGQMVLGPDGTLYYESYYDQKFGALDSATGAVKWTYTADSGGTATPAVATDGTVYFASIMYLYAMDGHAGTVKWKRRMDVSNSPTIGLDGTVYAAGANEMVALDPATGNPKWSYINGANGYSQVSLAMAANGTLYGTGYAGPQQVHLYSTDGKCGTQGWSVAINVNSMAIGADGTIYATADYASSAATTRVVAINPADGSTKWSTSNVPVQPTPPAVDDAHGQLYVMDGHGVVTALSTASGAVRWTFTPPTNQPVEANANGSPSVGADGTVYCVSQYRNYANNTVSAIFGIDGATGNMKFLLAPTGSTGADAATPTIGPDGTIYYRDERTGQIIAVQ